MAVQTAEEQATTNRRTAEAMLQETILPAFAAIRDELHRPAQQQYVTVTPLSATSAELIIARTPPAEGDAAPAADGLRYVLAVASGPRAIVVQRTVNGKRGPFLGQHYASSLRSQAIVDDVRRVWRRIEAKRGG